MIPLKTESFSSKNRDFYERFEKYSKFCLKVTFFITPIFPFASKICTNYSLAFKLRWGGVNACPACKRVRKELREGIDIQRRTHALQSISTAISAIWLGCVRINVRNIRSSGFSRVKEALYSLQANYTYYLCGHYRSGHQIRNILIDNMLFLPHRNVVRSVIKSIGRSRSWSRRRLNNYRFLSHCYCYVASRQSCTPTKKW